MLADCEASPTNKQSSFFTKASQNNRGYDFLQKSQTQKLNEAKLNIR